MDLLQSFKNYIRKETLFQQKDVLLVAVSGGVDSVVLCDLCRQAGFTFSIAHCNFGLRKKESDEDEQFVAAFAASMNVPYFIKRFDTTTYAQQNRLSIQEAARELRYNWFRELNDNKGWILTAHHADDNIETLLMSFFRGTGINGLKGIAPRNKRIVRPLLFANKEMLKDYASEHKLSYREDSSNGTDKYTRNYFRNELIPGIEKVFPKMQENLQDNIERFRDIQYIYDDAIAKLSASLIEQKGPEQWMPVLKLAKQKALVTIMYELLKDAGFTAAQVPGAIQLLNSETGRYIVSPTHRLLRNRKWLILSPLQDADNTIYLLDDSDRSLIFPGGKLQLQYLDAPQKIDPASSTVQVDAQDIRYPLVVRKWKQGDYFYPLGMQKKKKLSRFFIDQKIPLIQKENTWVIESDKKIIWIIGLRIDDRFKISDHTKTTIRFKYLPAE